MKRRTPERAQFLADMLTTAIEHGGYGFTANVDYVWDVADPHDVYAVVYDRHEAEDDPSARDKTWRIDIDTMAKGLGIVRKMDDATHAQWVRDLKLADRTNGDDGDYDVIGALLVLECALFGRGVYA